MNYASSKVDYSVGQDIYMLPSDMDLNIKSNVSGYNNKILISDTNLSLGINGKVNSTQITSHSSGKSTTNHKSVDRSKGNKVIEKHKAVDHSKSHELI